MSFTADQTCQLSFCLGMSVKGHLRMWAEINRDVGLVPTADISFWKAQKALRWR